MAVGTGITEIADSEEELLTSSPAAVSDASADKLSTTADQDAQAVAWPHQHLAKSNFNEALSRTDGCHVDQGKSSSNVETTQIDHADLGPTLQAGTNTTSACTTNNQVQAAICPSQDSVAAFSTADHTGNIDTDRTDDEASAARDTPETGSSMQHNEHVLIPTNTQVKLRECQTDAQQPMPESLPVNPTLSSQHDAFGNRSAILESDSNQQDSSQVGTVMNCVTKPGDSDGKNPAGRTRHDMSLALSVGLPITTATKRPYDMEPYIPVSFIGDYSNPINLGHLPAATGLTTTHISSAQDTVNVAATKLDLDDDRNVLENLDSGHFVKSAARPASELASSTNDYRMSGSGDFPHTAADQNTATNAHDPHAEQQVSIDVASGHEALDINTNTNQFKHAPADTPAEQGSEKGHVLGEGCAKSEAEQRSEPLIQSGVTEVHSHQEDDTKVEVDTRLVSTTPATNTQSQSSVSQTSEPASLRPAAKSTPQEVTLSELKAQKAALLASLVALPTIQLLIEENQTSDVDMSDDDDEPTEAEITAAANKMVKEHIKLLHEYNELKDIGQGLMGLIADQRGVRIVEVQDEFGLDAKD